MRGRGPPTRLLRIENIRGRMLVATAEKKKTRKLPNKLRRERSLAKQSKSTGRAMTILDESDLAEGIPEIHDALPAMAVEMAPKTSLEDALPASAGDQTPDACTTAKGGSTSLLFKA